MSSPFAHATRTCLAGLALAALLGCGASGPAVTPTTPQASAGPAFASTSEPVATESKPNPGSSDGVTCEQARDQYVEQIDMQSSGPADLNAQDFGQILNQGSYLEPCSVPHDSKVRICAAIREGAAVGVTVALDPAAPETELCVAKQVRALSFPSHPKMDFVTVRF